ncbi:MAG TPA: formimidoylglutamate deiminase, partial [Longimicrobiales bacterium]|nr:formimidoylglutamate deiminase [Longimicrobiales bacterium]
MQAVAPDFAYVGDEFVPDAAIAFNTAGRITYVGPAAGLPAGVVAQRLAGRAVLPGLVNAHSHAFQRVIRGWTQWKPARENADFWSWRDAMYRAVLRLSPSDLYQVSRFCFTEMLLSGYTTVGEFHYVQRNERGEPYGNPNELALEVLRAALDVGIRIVLLNVCYATGGVGEPLRAEQRRFATPHLDEFLEATDGLRANVEGSSRASVGVAPHSIRAVPREWLQPIAEYARRAGCPLHMHVSEQPAEVEACVEAYRRRPGEVLVEDGVVGSDFTAVHAMHLSAYEISAFGAAGVTVCACPTTERDLGDGILPAGELLEAGAHLCVGSDSQTVIDPWEELRSLEYHTRLRTLRRVALVAARDDRREVAPVLLRAGTQEGARALRLEAGRLETG